jgi:hypothetical protein
VIPDLDWRRAITTGRWHVVVDRMKIPTFGIGNPLGYSTLCGNILRAPMPGDRPHSAKDPGKVDSCCSECAKIIIGRWAVIPERITTK